MSAPPGKRERPGMGTEALAESPSNDYLKDTSADDRLAELKRRKQAALRCEPLASGRRDPLYAWEGRR